MKILALIHHPKGGCEYYRQIVPLDAIRGDDVEVKGTNNIEEMPDTELMLYDIFLIIRKDVFVLTEIRHKLEGGIRLTDAERITLTETRMIDRCHRLGLKVIFDIDDYWRLDQSHLLYKRYKEMSMDTNMINCIKKADMVTTTQGYILDKIKPFNENVHVIPNMIHPAHKQWVIEPTKPHDKIRIGWVGGIHHLEDVKLLREAFIRIWNDDEINDKIQFVLGGHVNDSDVHKYFIHIFSGNQHPKAHDNMLLLPAMDVFSFGQMYEVIDIVLAPLVDSDFNRCKSNLKVVEAGWKGKPVIASNVFPYANTITNNETGILIDNKRGHKDWYKHIKKLVLNTSERNRLAENLHNEIITTFDVRIYKDYIINLYNSVIER